MSANERPPHDPVDGASASLSLLAEALEPSELDACARTRLLDEVSGPERFTPWASEVARLFGLQLDDAREALRRIPDPDAWQPGLWPGSRLLVTPSLSQQHAVIAQLPRGLRIPKHRHQTRELTYILDGELFEDDGRLHGSGDLVEKTNGSEHSVTVSASADCLVVFSVSRA